MPKLMAKVEGKGNGIKTVIANMSEIAKALNRPPSYPTKYFGCELGAQTLFDAKNDRYIVNGEHDAGKLQSLLDGFIKKFVLCQGCENPETTLTVKKNSIFQSCKACGYQGQIDPRQKLTTFIIKNPPEQEGTDGSNVTKVKASGKRGKKNGETPAANGSPNNDAKGSDHGDSGASEELDDDDGWVDDTPDGAAAKKIEETDQLSGMIRGLLANADLDKSIEDRLDMFEAFVMKCNKSGPLDGKQILDEADRLDIKDKAVLVVCRLVFNVDILSQIQPNRNLFLRFTLKNKKAQKYLLGGLEQLIVSHKADLMPKAAKLLKAFYDADILEEEVLLEWGAKPTKKYVNKEESKMIIEKAEPFLKWLKEAEEEESDESDDDVEVDFGGKAEPIMTNGKSASAKPAKEANGGADGDDFNIDEI